MLDLLERLQFALADRYAVESELGRGGMATVFLAEDLKHHRKVAIKVLHPDLAATVGAERFLREIEIVAGLNHPHILALHDSGAEDGLFYFVMPYVEGESLRERLARDRQLPIDEALMIARQIAAALEHAHARGVVHRDIKPANILLSEAGALVADFGVARATAGLDQTKLTRAGMTAGTPDYMSPEQAGGEEIDARSDLYSLGCVLYEMLAGEPPLTGSTPQAILARRLTETPTPLPVLRDTVPEAVDGVVRRALARLPVDRYGSAADLESALTDAAEGRAPSPASRPPKRRMNRAAVAGAAAGLVLAAVWGATQLFPPDAPELDPLRVAVLPLENATGDPRLDHLGQDVAARLSDAIRREEAGEPVSAVAVEEARTSSGPSVPGIARLTGARRIVTGAYSREGDTLRFRATVADAEDGADVASATTTGPADAPDQAIRELEEQVAVILLMRDPAGWPSVPSLEAYRAQQRVSDLFENGLYYPDGFEAAVEAAGLDSTFHLPRLFAYAMAPDSATADSVWQTVDPRRSEIPDGSLSWFESLEVIRGLGDREAFAEEVYRATGRQTEALADYGTYFWHARNCMALNRPGEAAAAHEEAVRLAAENPTSVRWTSCAACARASMRGSVDAYHVLGRDEDALEAARTLLALNPDEVRYRYLELLSLVGLGRIEEVERKAGELSTLPTDGMLPGEAMGRVGLDLRQHGHAEAGARVLARADEWYERLPGELAARPRNRLLRSYVSYYAERWDDARMSLEVLASDLAAATAVPERTLYTRVVGALGRIAARTGDEQARERHGETLRRLDASTALLRGQPKLELAQIAALTGDREDALRLLRQAVAEGAGYDVFVHPDLTAFDFEEMADYAPYQEFLRPKG